MRLLIHAPNVHQGGGKTLLLALLGAGKRRSSISAVVDARLEVPSDLDESVIVARVNPGVVARLLAEWRLRTLMTGTDALLCFGNLPPLFSVPGHVVLFLQNRYLVRGRSTRGLPVRVRLRNQAERVWLRTCLTRTSTVIVQTASMAREVQEELGVEAVVLPFAVHQPASAPQRPNTDPPSTGQEVDFLYVASGEPHKNHGNLLAAWRLLATDGMNPSLCLTVSETSFPTLCGEIDEARRSHGLNIENVGAIPAARLEELYARSRAIIYPSRFESFGLPLLEAEARGLPVIAAELDYVRDLVDPIESFDPESPVSIARAVRRFLGRGETRAPILKPDEFLDRLVDCVRGAR
jgi:glycosyltransferase involved in cell wall biosynthesis